MVIFGGQRIKVTSGVKAEEEITQRSENIDIIFSLSKRPLRPNRTPHFTRPCPHMSHDIAITPNDIIRCKNTNKSLFWHKRISNP